MDNDTIVKAEELKQAEEFLRRRGVPEDQWLLESGQQYYAVAELKGSLLGLSDDAINAALNRGEFPNATLPSRQMGWRIPRSGVIYYLAVRRGFQTQQQAAG